ncbi:8-oxo-dGTP diphosphatase [Komagataeibacter europaeus]|nr:8-oxo-dGTP diphosphatase [Komagataeibacter europaeus]
MGAVRPVSPGIGKFTPQPSGLRDTSFPDMTTQMMIELIAVLTAVRDDVPQVMTIDHGRLLPSGPLESTHRSLQAGVRAWVERQTGHPIGHVEQLYTFADHDRLLATGQGRLIAISYLALTRSHAGETGWRDWYDYFPWENTKTDAGRDCLAIIERLLCRWVADMDNAAARVRQWQRCVTLFAIGDMVAWNDELVLQRYELLYEAGLVAEAGCPPEDAVPGQAMHHDHRRILATGMARLRAKIRYRPVVFELMPEEFTLLQLQRVMESLSGIQIHKQNFRRLIMQQQLVEETGGIEENTGGRPARLYRFCGEVRQARQFVGTKIPLFQP